MFQVQPPLSLILFLPAVISASIPNLAPSGVTNDSSTASGQTFNFIIVGAGLAGVTVAARLAENSSVSVLLVEAGNDDRNDPRGTF